MTNPYPAHVSRVLGPMGRSRVPRAGASGARGRALRASAHRLLGQVSQ